MIWGDPHFRKAPKYSFWPNMQNKCNFGDWFFVTSSSHCYFFLNPRAIGMAITIYGDSSEMASPAWWKPGSAARPLSSQLIAVSAAARYALPGTIQEPDGNKFRQCTYVLLGDTRQLDNMKTSRHAHSGSVQVNILWMPVVWCSRIIPNRCTICQRAIFWVVPGYEHPFYQLKIRQSRRTKRQHCFGSWKVVGFCHKQFLTHLVEHVGIPGRVALAVAEVDLMSHMLVKNHGSIFFATLNKGKLVASEHEKCTMFYIVWSMFYPLLGTWPIVLP